MVRGGSVLVPDLRECWEHDGRRRAGGGHHLAGLVYPLAFVAECSRSGARVYGSQDIVTAFVESARFVLKFLLPVRLLVEAFRGPGGDLFRLAVTHRGRVLDGRLMIIAARCSRFLTTPFPLGMGCDKGSLGWIKPCSPGPCPSERPCVRIMTLF